MELYYIQYNELQRCFHYESKQEYESRPSNGYQVIEKCFSLEEASRRTAELVKDYRNGNIGFMYGY